MTIELLLLEMLKRISIAIILGLILTQTRFIDHIIKYRFTKYDQIICIALFSTMSIIASYAGVPVNDALANSRMVGIMAAGLIAGRGFRWHYSWCTPILFGWFLRLCLCCFFHCRRDYFLHHLPFLSRPVHSSLYYICHRCLDGNGTNGHYFGTSYPV